MTDAVLPLGEGTAPGHDDVRLHYRVSGQGPVLIAHPGGPGTGAAFLGDLAGLDEVATIVWLDPRGTGGSTAPAEADAYTLVDYAADVDAVRQHLGLDRVGLLGFSHGGMVAMRYAIDHSDHLRRLVLLDTAPTLDAVAMERVSTAMDRRQGEPWYAEVRPLLDSDEVDATDEEALATMLAILPMYFHRWDETARRFTATLADAGFHSRVGPAWTQEEATMDLRPELGRISAPTLVVVGEDDFICDVVSAAEMVDGIRGARLVAIPEAGHFPWVEQPAAFRTALDRFLTEG
ncbi:MAG TPA: alpha/beta hydrolase [Candidatus Limnocylindria bacterium]